MKKFTNIFLAVLITLFSFPIGGLNVNAEGKVYSDIADRVYETIAKAMHATEDKASGAAGYINEKALLSISGDTIKLTITFPNIEGSKITGLQVEGKGPIDSGYSNGKE